MITYSLLLSYKLIFISNRFNQVAFFIVIINSIYSAFFDNKAIIATFLECLLIDLFYSVKMKLDINFYLV